MNGSIILGKTLKGGHYEKMKVLYYKGELELKSFYRG